MSHTMFDLDSLTEEQQAVANLICEEKTNVIVNAVAGSGKTRTALTTACAWLEKTMRAMPVLLLAYNKRLELDMSAQKEENVPHKLRPHIEIRTIHGLGHHYFEGYGMTTDRDLSTWTRNRTPNARTIPKFGLVIVDEAQDLTPILFDFIHYFLSLLPTRPQLLILGDPFQLLYGFKGADVTYLIDAEKHFEDVICDAPFKHARLSICFRITHEMAEWINTHLNPNNLRDAQQEPGWFERNKEMIAAWWADGIQANPKRPPEPNSVRFFRRSLHAVKNGGSGMDPPTKMEIRGLLEQHDVGSTVVLAPAITDNQYSPARLVANWFKELNKERCSWHIDGGKSVHIAEVDVKKNKRKASTIHRYKGQENDGVVLLGLDAFGEKKSKKNPLELYNVLYVGATRARKQLLIVEWSDVSYCTVRLPNNGRELEEKKPGFIGVDALLRHCPYNELLCDESPKCITTKRVYSIDVIPFNNLDLIVPGAHHGKQPTIEEVSSILDMAVLVRFQLLVDNGVLDVPSLDDMPERERKEVPHSLKEFVTKLAIEAVSKRQYTWLEVLRIALAWITISTRFFFQWRQTNITEKWTVVRYSVKLDCAVENMVHLLYYAFCDQDSLGTSQQEYENKLSALRSLRKEKRLIMHQPLAFELPNAEFSERYGSLLGVTDIALLSPADAKRRAESLEIRSHTTHKCHSHSPDVDEESKTEDLGHYEIQEPVTVVSIEETDDDDDRLSIACKGSLFELSSPFESSALSNCHEGWKTMVASKAKSRGSSSLGTQEKSNRPKLFVAYPMKGRLTAVNQHMDALEFLLRLASRKLNVPFVKPTSSYSISELAKSIGDVHINQPPISDHLIWSIPNKQESTQSAEEYLESQKEKSELETFMKLTLSS